MHDVPVVNGRSLRICEMKPKKKDHEATEPKKSFRKMTKELSKNSQNICFSIADGMFEVTVHSRVSVVVYSAFVLFVRTLFVSL